MPSILLSLLLFIAASPAFAADAKVCADLIVRSPEPLQFSATEKNFLCGDRNNAPWAKPPESQIKVFLVSFLQARGYFQPTFSRDGAALVTDVGDKSRIRILTAAGAPEQLDFGRFWVPARKPLTPSLLDEYQDLVHGRIESEGYPCPRVAARANASEGSMTLDVNAGPRQRVATIKEDEISGLRPGTLRRYFPIEEGDWFDGDLVYIAGERIKAEDMLSSSYMVSNCGPDGAVIEHRAVAGPPRRMTVGFGVNTETYFLFRSTYRNARVDANASRFDAILSANYFDQKVQSSFDWYFLDHPSSLHFQPTLAFERIAEQSSEERTTKATWHLGGYRDGLGQYWRLYVGPNYNLIYTLRGDAPKFVRIVEWEVSGRIMSHDYEFYRGAPRTGHLLDWRYTAASQKTFSTMTVRTLSVTGERLFNWASLEPPLFVLGLRGGAATTDAAPDVELPDEYLRYLGGSSDVRGFSRRAIPAKNAGARSAAFLGAEARLVTILPESLQPFAFVDAGKVGGSYFAYERPVYWSPGSGLRWQSPFGSLRASVARGFIADDRINRGHTVHAGWTAFVSFGEEF